MTTLSEQQEQTDHADEKSASFAAVVSLMGSVLVVVLAVAGHVVMAERSYPLWGAVLFGLALSVLFGPPLCAGAKDLARDRGEAHIDEEASPLVRQPVLRLALLINSVILAGLATWLFADNRLDRGFWLWIVALLYYAASQLERPALGWRSAFQEWRRAIDGRGIVLLALIVSLAVLLRVHRLVEVPVEMTSDHAEKLLDVYDVLNGARPIFFERNTGREAFQFYLTAALIQWTPLQLGHLALKVGTALFGILTVPLTYLLGKELYGRSTGLLAAFFLAISHWHVTISRVGLRFPFTAAFAAPALYFLLRALRRNRRNEWLAAGAFLGIGLHTYTAMRIVPLLFVLLILMRLGRDLAVMMRKRDAQVRVTTASLPTLTTIFWVNAARGGAMALLLFLPLLRYMADNPTGFWYRAASRAQAAMPVADLWRTFWQNMVDALLMFNYRGDVVPINTVPEAAVLGPVMGGLFVLGMAYLMWRLIVRRELTAAYVLVSFVAFLLPSVLSLAFPGENPSVVRTGGAAPFVMIVAALPLVLFVEHVWTARRQRFLAPLILTVILGSAILFNYGWYFREYDTNIRRSLWNATELGEVLRQFEESGGKLQNAYHVAYPHWVDTRNIAINAGDIRWNNAITDLELISFQAELPGRKLYLVHPEHEGALKVLRDNYPDGKERLQPTERPGKQFIVFEVSAPGS